MLLAVYISVLVAIDVWAKVWTCRAAIDVWVCRGCSMRLHSRLRVRNGMRPRLRGVGIGIVVVVWGMS